VRSDEWETSVPEGRVWEGMTRETPPPRNAPRPPSHATTPVTRSPPPEHATDLATRYRSRHTLLIPEPATRREAHNLRHGETPNEAPIPTAASAGLRALCAACRAACGVTP